MKPHRMLVAFFSRLVPRRFRGDWKNEWDAEFHSREQRSSQGVLFQRSMGAFWDALAMQPRRLEEDLFQDIRYGLRMLLQTKGWTAVAILSLALGIGANTALFSVFSSIFLQSLPVDQPERLVVLKWAGANGVATDVSGYGTLPMGVGASFSYPAFQRIRQENRTLENLAAFRPKGGNLVAGGQADMVSLELVSGNFHEILGARAVAGRTLNDSDDKPTAAPVAVISYRFWQRRFSGDPAVVDSVANINGTGVTIVGVTGPDFYGAMEVAATAPDLWIPLMSAVPLENSERFANAAEWWLLLIGRTRPGVSVESVQADVQPIFRQLGIESGKRQEEALRAQNRSPDSSGTLALPQLLVTSGARGVYDPDPDQVRTVAILMSVVGIVLVVVCANIANLLLARANVRQTEVSIRLSLGASRLRLVRQVLTESILLAGIGGIFGIGLGYVCSRLLPLWTGEPQPLDWRVIAFTGTLTLMTGIVFGLAPAIRSSRADLGLSLKEAGRHVVRSRSLLGKTLLIAQVAISVTLLIGAGLLIQTVRNLYSVDVGFDTRNLLLFRIDPAGNGYTGNRFNVLNEQIAARLEAIPGIRSVALSSRPLVNGGSNNSRIHLSGTDSQPARIHDVSRLITRHTFFETMQIPVVSGRALRMEDNESGPLVAVINQTLARQLFPGSNAVGERLGFDPRHNSEIEIVGVVQDTKNFQLTETIAPTVYLSYLQKPTAGPRMTSPTFELRTVGPALAMTPQVREAIREIEPNLPLIDIRSQVDEVGRRVSQQRLLAISSSVFAGLTLILASSGLFSLMSYSVTRRRSEIGIRLAIGARPNDVIGMVMQETLVLIAAGLALGIGAAVAFSHLVSANLFGLAPRDPATIVTAALVVLLASALAGLLPALRASRVDPMVALRHE